MANLLARCNKTTGSVTAGVLLFRICYWMPRAQQKRGDQMWVAKTHEQWAEEAGISAAQVKRAFHILRRMGLVVTEKHKFGTDTIGFVRLSEAGMAVALEEHSAPPGQSPSAPTGQCEIAPSIDHHQLQSLEHHLFLTKELMFDQHACASAQAHTCEETSHPENEKNMPTLAEALSVKKPIKKNASAPEPLGSLWRRVMGEEYGQSVYVGPYTVKELAQLKRLENVLVPDSRRLLERVVRDWADFAWEVRAKHGLKTSPSEPQLGFVVRFYSVAVALWGMPVQDKPKQPAPAPKESAPVQLTAPTKTAPAKATKAEVMAILNGDDGD